MTEEVRNIGRFEGGTIDQRILETGTRVIRLENTTVMPTKGVSEDEQFAHKDVQAQRVIEVVDLPEYKLTLREAVRTLGFIAKNSLHTAPHYSGGFAKKMHEAQLSDVHRGDKVILFFHGYMQNAGSAVQLHKDAKAKGIKVVAVDYNYKIDPKDFAEEVLLPAQRKVLARGADEIITLGHSTGADNPRYSLIHNPNVVDLAVDNRMTYILSAPLTSGLRGKLNLAQQAISLVMPQRDKMWTSEGTEQFLALNHPLPKEVEAYTFLCAGDFLVTPECGLDTNNNAVNVIVPYGGHFEGTGVSQRINEHYIDLIINGILRPKSF